MPLPEYVVNFGCNEDYIFSIENPCYYIIISINLNLFYII